MFSLISVMYVVPQLLLIAVAAFFWKRYPRPSLYLALMASLELLGSMERSRFQRYRALLLSGLGAVVAGLIATAIWAAFT